MKIIIISPGKSHDPLLVGAIAEYEKRLQNIFPIEWLHPKPDTKEKEAEGILAKLKSDDTVILLDERGIDIDTQTFAKLLDKQVTVGTKRLVFIIGGAFGVTDEIHARANKTLKLSSLVFPHMLVRLILVEQIYRAHSILSGGKYHHA